MKSELVCRVKYCNTLPDIPFDPKFITYPFDSTRFIQYNPTSLERSYKYEVLTEHDLGVTIDLINKDTYINDHGAQLDPADEKLLEEDILTPQDSKRSRHHARSVSWLRRTEYISTEQTRFQPQTMDKVEAKVGYSIKKNFKEETIYMDRESQIKAINKTFEDSKVPIEKHYSKPNVTPVEVFSVFPDFKVWKYPCAQVIFDSDPAPTGRPVPAQIEEMSQAMIRGVMDESGEQFVAYFLPMEDTLEKRRRDFVNMVDYEDEEEYNYKMSREYNWNVKSKASKGYEENYFLVMRQDVRLSKRRQKVGQPPNNTRLVVRHRPLNAQEFRMQRYRERMLEPTGEEEEEGSGEEGEDKSDNEAKDDDDDDDDDKDEDKEGEDKERTSDKEKEGSEEEKDASEDEKQNDQDKEDADASGNDKSDSDQVLFYLNCTYPELNSSQQEELSTFILFMSQKATINSVKSYFITKLITRTKYFLKLRLFEVAKMQVFFLGMVEFLQKIRKSLLAQLSFAIMVVNILRHSCINSSFCLSVIVIAVSPNKRFVANPTSIFLLRTKFSDFFVSIDSGSGSEEERLTSKTSRSPSRSRSTSKSPPRSRSRSKSKSRSRSRSSSAASNKSASGSGSASASESGSESDKLVNPCFDSVDDFISIYDRKKLYDILLLIKRPPQAPENSSEIYFFTNYLALH
uniref:RNA polymerase II-associated factor 1 homolog n=1 Tax=Timema californicum TaxID=61474 RepID=A0A7R9P8D2_TIMCA|nr:unnamed protein product [Timema californicum]